MDKVYLMQTEHSVRPTANGGLIVTIRPPEPYMGGVVHCGELSFSNIADYLKYLRENATQQAVDSLFEKGTDETSSS